MPKERPKKTKFTPVFKVWIQIEHHHAPDLYEEVYEEVAVDEFAETAEFETEEAAIGFATLLHEVGVALARGNMVFYKTPAWRKS